ncbi:MAG: murein DD-endopeptidase MepM/ murein hydrolase activator NlpD [Halocynthiibacter sp.]|jgi:murein DD-endopeptidase MepM/ murein hydrolase activator NlpD
MKLLTTKLNALLERTFPERRIFLRSETETRYIRLGPATQLFAFVGSSATVAWAIVATAIILMDSIGSGNIREQAAREQALYEQRLNALASERDNRADEAAMAQQRFSSALGQISTMQSSLLASEDRRKELETGIEVIQSTLRRTMKERDGARGEADHLTAQLDGKLNDKVIVAQGDVESTLDVLTQALQSTSAERDAMYTAAQSAEEYAAKLEHERDLMEEKNDRIFEQLEDAVTVSIEPLDKMFRAAGMPTDKILDTVRRGYSGQGGPTAPITFSTMGQEPDADSLRANGILEKMDRMNLYRIAAQKAPFGMPLKSSFRYTSGFGQRWGRMHAGTDFAAAYGTPIYATADGVVTHAGWQSGYGRLVKIQHEFGIETRYAHQAKIRVKVGQRVSRGEQIGDMGNSGRSTGTHLHYEVRVGGQAVNPMTYIKAAKDVF